MLFPKTNNFSKWEISQEVANYDHQNSNSSKWSDYNQRIYITKLYGALNSVAQIAGSESLELLKFAFNCGNTRLAMKKKKCKNYLALELGLVWLEKKLGTLKDYLLLVNKDASLIAIENLKTSLLKSSNGFFEWKIIE